MDEPSMGGVKWSDIMKQTVDLNVPGVSRALMGTPDQTYIVEQQIRAARLVLNTVDYAYRHGNPLPENLVKRQRWRLDVVQKLFQIHEAQDAEHTFDLNRAIEHVDEFIAILAQEQQIAHKNASEREAMRQQLDKERAQDFVRALYPKSTGALYGATNTLAIISRVSLPWYAQLLVAGVGAAVGAKLGGPVMGKLVRDKAGG